MIADIFWWGEVEQELRDIGKEEYRFKGKAAREECMVMIDEKRNQTLYPHQPEDCTEKCRKRGKFYLEMS